MTAFANHFSYEFKTGLRNPTLLLMNYLFPLGFYAMMGLVMTKINPGFTQLLIPAMVVLAAMASTILGLPGPLVEAREAGIFRSFKINGVPVLSILAIPTLTTIFHALIVATLIALTGAPLFGGAAPTNWGAFILVTLVSVFSFGAIGSLIGVVATSSRGTVLYSQLIFLPSMLLGGMMMPLSILPASVRPISLLLPTAHAMQAFTGLAYGQETVINPVVALVTLAVSGLLAFGLAAYLFNWDSRNSARRGHPVMALLALAPYLIGMFLK
jgi:ABC-2 type transport system permease protein